MKKLRFLSCLALIICIIAGTLSMTSCGKAPSGKKTEGLEIIHEPEFGGVYIKMTGEDFNSLGYSHGDSVNVEFSNGYKLEGIPYYNGYYTKNGEPLLIDYPGYDYIKAAINNGDDLWNVAGLEDGMTASITREEGGKFLKIQQSRDIHYEDNRKLFESDEVFANFRSINTYGMKKNTVYRSASPCDNQHNRATFVNSLIKTAGVNFILNLSDDDAKIEKYMSAEDLSCNYFKMLYETGKVAPIALNMNYGSDEFKEKVAKGLSEMAKREGPYLIHCTEGKDRTGFVCMLIEALCGAGYKDIEKDYMLTYSNYYGITRKTDSEKYETIVENVLKPMIQSLTGDETIDIETTDLTAFAEDFLLSGGMTAEEIAMLRKNISGK